MSTEIEVLIADDHPVVREGLRQAIEKASGLKVVAEAGDGQEALVYLRQARPHVAVLDIDMPLLDGFAVARAVRNEELPVKIIFLTVHREESFLNKALKIGAQGFISKDSALAEVVTGIKTVLAGQDHVSPMMTRHIISGRRTLEQGLGLTSLTPAERKVLKLIAEYRTTKEISPKVHLHGLTQKMRLPAVERVCFQPEHRRHCLLMFARMACP